MTTQRDPDRLIREFLLEGPTDLADPVYDAVRATIERKRQRVVIGPWRMTFMNRLVPFAVGGAALVAVLAVGSQLLAPAAPGGVGAAPSAEPTAAPSPTQVGGSVILGDEASTATEVDAVADGATVSGAAVTTLGTGTHTVGLECAVRDGDTWAFGGTIEQTTVPGERPGSWSAVIVRDGSPQQVAIWLSDDKTQGIDCDGWLTGAGLSGIGAEDLVPVESGALVPPPDLAT
jgi:hypothetical protein